MITIIDYGSGNLGSILNMFKKVGANANVSAAASDVRSAKGIVLPGVGAFDPAIRNLRATGLIPILEKEVLQGQKPLIGICLGMQLLARESEEGSEEGLGWIGGRVERLSPGAAGLKIPHMGWNSILARSNNWLFGDLEADPRFYFLHSYHFVCDNEEDVAAETEYGIPFTSVCVHNNILAVQFHPEKSHRFGMTLLRNFADLAAT